jgi:hypothetical protein
MADDARQDDLQARLMALVDGELTGDEAAALRARVATDTELAARLASARAMKAAVGRSMAEPSRVPADVRTAVIAAMERDAADAPEAAPVGRADERAAVVARIGPRGLTRWMPAAVAAVLFFAALMLFFGNPDAGDGPGLDSRFAAVTIEGDTLSRFNFRHQQCGRDVMAMYGVERFPTEVSALPGALADYFDRPVQGRGLDLSRIGYDYQVTGLCSIPGRGAVHVLYTAKPETGRSGTLSLWIRPFNPTVTGELEGDRLYRAVSPDPAKPMLIWREGDLVYYLMGDRAGDVERAANTLHPRPNA